MVEEENTALGSIGLNSNIKSVILKFADTYNCNYLRVEYDVLVYVFMLCNDQISTIILHCLLTHLVYISLPSK